MASRFDTAETGLGGLWVVTRRRLEDHRGYLSRLFCPDELGPFGLSAVAQINQTLTRRRGAIRGMHFQYAPWAEAKLVICLRGEILDVAVDLRKGSPTYLQWHAEVLSPENQRSLLIPEGFAHGFQTLNDDCELLYVHSAPYRPDAEGGVHPLDPRLAIRWPLEVTDMSDRDGAHRFIDDSFKGFD